MLEANSVLQNMSAPPRSKVVIAPHRRKQSELECLSFYLPALKKRSWQEDLLEITGLKSLQEVQRLAEYYLVELQPPSVFPIIKRKAGQAVHPLLSVGILSRTVGNLFLQRRKPELIYAHLSRRVTIIDPDFIQRILSIEEKLWERK